jgi:hypothetical protein
LKRPLKNVLNVLQPMVAMTSGQQVKPVSHNRDLCEESVLWYAVVKYEVSYRFWDTIDICVTSSLQKQLIRVMLATFTQKVHVRRIWNTNLCYLVLPTAERKVDAR